MSETALIADQLRRAFYGGAWHGDSLYEILTGVTAAKAAAHPMQNGHSIWELLLHIGAWDGAVRRRMTGVAVELSDAENFPPISATSDAAWGKALEYVRGVHDELTAAVLKFGDARLEEKVPGKHGAHYTFYYMLSGLAQHELYHAGQIALLKKV